MFQELTEMATDARALILAIAVVVWLASTLAIAVARRSILAAAGVFVGGAFLIWGMYNADFLRNKAGEDIQGQGVVVVVVDYVGAL